MITLNTILSSLFYLLPLYLFVLAPLLRQYFPSDDASNTTTTNIPFDPFNNSPLIPSPSEFESNPDAYDLPYLDPDFLSPDDPSSPSYSPSEEPLTCPQDTYKTHILSRTPLIIYIENFLSGPETTSLLSLTTPQSPSTNQSTNHGYTPSIIYDGTSQRIDPTRRLSDRALLPAHSTPVRCLNRRAASFQGWRPYLHIEPLWAQRYNVSGHYTHHYDWAGSAARGGDRATTFMVYLDDGCKGGGTNFPRLVRPVAREWCRFIECPVDSDGEGEGMGGITFKPIAGNAVFWENLRPDGSGYPETWHAALPVTEGVKVGLNIWSWYQPPRRRV
ncbi:oxidoreductase, 2OG-Fe(II) oxygenase family [Aspergillus candidus]|uniref:Prolyl 4-hydroxylase alpha subunit domain-containing protein n=1 Tax=Aspergillus candidus TaxID=41067 RepID=A0A2I2FJJ7_ASPCN|nr:hypothetical protein BDW47DRAFT_100831 [Aspergillus candidus]PLB40784.1 hypothetical protein BDW47DRAFT_100831 [Aspergillus candidus]